jgi:glycosyltransferase involved in cell wall biosynthesis
MSQKHIAVICSYLNFAGGYERIVVEAANLFAEKGLRTSLILFAETTESFYPIHPDITIIQRDVNFGITEKGNTVSRKVKMVEDLAELKKIIRRIHPDVLICTEYHFAIAAILCGAKKYSKVISWEHTHHGSLKPNLFWKTLYRLTYPKLNNIVCLNKREEAYFEKFTKTQIIPNFARNKTNEYSQLQSKTILTVATLIPRKGIDLLIQSAKAVLIKYPDWKWKLIGSGPMKAQVEYFIQNESLHDRFILQDSVSSEIAFEYLNASIFVLTSRSETLPMVLIEAVSYGLPCISFDCPTGPADIINHNIDGLLVEKENPTKLTETISLLVENDEKRKEMGNSAIENSKRFSSETIYQQWETLFNAE